MVDIDDKKAWKFDGGLDLDVFDLVGVLKLPTYVKVLDRALMAEAILAAKKQALAPTTEWKGKRSRFNFKRGWSFPKRQNTGSSSNSSQNSLSIPNCSDCGMKHKGACYCASGACFRCGNIGRMVRGCLMRSNDVNRPMASSAGSAFVARLNARTNARGNTGNKTLRQGRVFALVPGDVQNIESVVSGIISICAHDAHVLMDSSSTHSFVSHAFSRKLTRPLESMNYLLSISTPSGGSMVCAYLYPSCDIVIGDVTLYVDLLPLGIDHFECILGMDWLTKYCATIDCVNKSVIFHPHSLPEFMFIGNGVGLPPYLISAMKVVKLLRKGYRGYRCCVLTMASDNPTIENIPIVNEFLDVFPTELPRELFDREIEFTIDVVHETQPIFKTPYRMSTSELKELKI
ncbi:uncharacterized protein LOC114286168 [Camellia sinensis]|uniref:uncharacterized protein LOC114286168 n=1 Tax=Camellia sinensis TaxID=4442 RepID=UPI001036CB67|nr:uncharacterized protein LOC114286168 [Camellia sinensis]